MDNSAVLNPPAEKEDMKRVQTEAKMLAVLGAHPQGVMLSADWAKLTSLHPFAVALPGQRLGWESYFMAV